MNLTKVILELLDQNKILRTTVNTEWLIKTPPGTGNIFEVFIQAQIKLKN